jgi:tungstate transport system substrate-binding protein
MKKTRFISAIFILAALFMLFGQSYAGEAILTMSTTTSTQASGLLDVLLPEFEKDTGIKVKVIAKGTGAAIRDGIDGNVDVIFVHAKSREEKFIEDGYGTKRYAVMHNDFVIIGPQKDPAGIKGGANAAQALEKIAKANAPFVSRGDDSGTHTKEQALWKQTSLKISQTSTTIVKKGKKRDINYEAPDGKWYLSLGQGMGKVITYADEKNAYTLADRGTYIKYKFGREPAIDLDILCEGDPQLNNPYGIIPINPKNHPQVKHDLAVKFSEWIVSKKGQSLIGGYRVLGKQLFYPDAQK